MAGKFEIMGPLDMVRHLNATAGDYDIYANMHMQDDEHGQIKFKNRVEALNANHPLIGEEVIIYGNVLSVSFGEMGEACTAVVPYNIEEDSSGLARVDREYLAEVMGEHHVPVVGEYKGYDDWRVFDTKTQEWSYRITHKVAKEIVEYTDPYGADHSVTNNTFVYAWGSKIFPIDPVNAHSFEDLKNDKIVQHGFDSIAYDEHLDRPEAIVKIGQIARKAFSGPIDQPELDHQRISYLNSLGLLEGLSVLTRDYLNVSGFGDELKVSIPSPSDQPCTQIEPGFFVLAESYGRDKMGQVFYKRGQRDLCIKTPVDDGAAVVVPVPNIVGFGLPMTD